VNPKKLRLVAVGGTFDRLHVGHMTLILKAFEVGERVLIGLSTDEFARRMGKPADVEPYEVRLRELREFLRKRSLEHRAEIVPLRDPYGPAAYDGRVEGLVVSVETAWRAEEINELRRVRGLKPLRVFVVDMVLAEDGRPVSSSRVRAGEVDRFGRIVGPKA